MERDFEAQSHALAQEWGMVHGRENCLPCHRWAVEQVGRVFKVAIRWRSSNELKGYAS